MKKHPLATERTVKVRLKSDSASALSASNGSCACLLEYYNPYAEVCFVPSDGQDDFGGKNKYHHY